MADVTFHCGDALAILPTLPDSSVSLIVTDPPYHRVKAEAWDRQWKTDADYLAWIGRLCDEWRRVLRPNGSLYVFASPRMAARAECVVGERFEVLNHIVWRKPEHSTSVGRYDETAFRQYYPNTERVIFAEQFGADNAAKGEAGYVAKCDELRGEVFEPLRAYLDGERQAAGLSNDDVRRIVGCAPGSGLPGHWFTNSQWMLPTAKNYARLQTATGRFVRPHQDLRREYASLRGEYEFLRLKYEDLRREYEDLRRPFTVSADVPYTDVWDFPTVSSRPGKHPCEKPLRMIEHVVAASSRPGDLVLDCFAGSGVTGEACRNLGRDCVLIDSDPRWVARARQRCGAARPSILFATTA